MSFTCPSGSGLVVVQHKRKKRSGCRSMFLGLRPRTLSSRKMSLPVIYFAISSLKLPESREKVKGKLHRLNNMGIFQVEARVRFRLLHVGFKICWMPQVQKPVCRVTPAGDRPAGCKVSIKSVLLHCSQFRLQVIDVNVV